MVHTDGRPTITNAPARAPFEVVGEIVVDISEALCERSYAGVAVTLHRFQNDCVIRVIDGEGEHEAIVPSEKALDAFEHPYVYLPR